jgi:PAS domain S-box-containing protein
MSAADQRRPSAWISTWLKEERLTQSLREAIANKPLLFFSALLLVAVDVLRFFVLPRAYQSAFTDGLESVVVALAAVACATAARHSTGISRALWATIALYFALNLAADVHDFVAESAIGIGHVLPPLEFLGWCAYLPLALIIFFPITENAQLKWKWLPIIDFLQAAIAIMLACFQLVYLHHRSLNQEWTEFGEPEALRNVLICAGLLLRTLVDPSQRARKIYRLVGMAFTAITVAKLISPAYDAVTYAIIRPSAFLVIGLVAANWDGNVADSIESGQRKNRLRLILSMLAATMLLVVLLLVNVAPARYLLLTNSIATVSVLFILRSTLAEYNRYGAETALAESEDRYRDLVEHSEDLVCTHDLHGNLLSANAAAGRLLGYDVAELLRIPMGQLVAPEFRSQFDQYLQRIRQNGADSGLLCVLTKDGRRRIWEYQNTLRIEGVASPVVRGMARDVTERKQAEDALRRSEQRMRLFIEHAPAGAALLDREMRYVQASRRWREDYGLGDCDLSGISHYEVFPEVPERWKEAHRRCLAGEVLREECDRFERTDGKVQWIRWELHPWYEKGQIGGIAIFAEDVTARKRAADALQKSEERYRTLFEKMVAGVGMISMEGIILDCNDAWARFFGHNSAAECRGAQIRDYYPDPARRETLLKELRRDGVFVNREWELRQKDGTPRWFLINSVLLDQDEGEPLIQSTMFDITERKSALDALRRSEENYRNFVAQSSEGIFRQDIDAPIPIDLAEEELVQRILHGSYMADCNDAMAKMYGLHSIENFVGRRLTEFVDPNDPANLELTREYIRSGFRVVDRESFETDAQGNPKVFRNSMIGIVEDGKLVRTWGIQRDVTEHVRLEDERRQAVDALRQSEERFRVALKDSSIYGV